MGSALEQKRRELDAINREVEDERRRQVLPDPVASNARDDRRLQLEREIAAGEGSQFAEPLPIDATIGDEWHLVQGGGDALLFCGDAGEAKASLFHFLHVEEVRLRRFATDLEIPELQIAGLDVYGLFIVRNSAWKNEILSALSKHSERNDDSWWTGFEHFILRGKGGDLWCFARSYESRPVSDSIVQIRDRVSSWRDLI